MEENVMFPVVVEEVSVAGRLVILGGKRDELYFLTSPVPKANWNFGAVVALVFEGVPLQYYRPTQGTDIVYPYKRDIVVGTGASWYVDYNIDIDKIKVEKYENHS